ncbi:hypothetical protein [Rosistilla oblonga]|uniref:hypothetical protein n=1 Tax=Rosistilla oblonga TaxID=2527990 RepID=UPI003A977602
MENMVLHKSPVVVRSLWIFLALICGEIGTSVAHAAIDVGLDSRLPEIPSMQSAANDAPVRVEASCLDFDFQIVDGSSSSGPLSGLLADRTGVPDDLNGRWICWRRERADELRGLRVLDEIPRGIPVSTD